ncbi:hypothetical protein AUJ38_02925 [bacterium CG1_02_42_9]|nr:MAG: hypothetical protein AUJ38_02925 [bacterium CG1_02_42_9]
MKAEVEIRIPTEKGKKLRGEFYPPNDKDNFPAVLTLVGHRSTYKRRYYQEIAANLVKKGIGNLLFNYRGHGEDEESYSQYGFLDWLCDSRLVLDWLLKQKKVDKKRIGMLGVSMGGALAGQLLSQNNEIISLILRAPADSNLYVKVLKKSSSYINQFKGDYLLILSEKDELFPLEREKELFWNQALSSSKKLCILKEASHSLVKKEWQDEFIAASLEWFFKTLG